MTIQQIGQLLCDTVRSALHCDDVEMLRSRIGELERDLAAARINARLLAENREEGAQLLQEAHEQLRQQEEASAELSAARTKAEVNLFTTSKRLQEVEQEREMFRVLALRCFTQLRSSACLHGTIDMLDGWVARDPELKRALEAAGAGHYWKLGGL